MSDMEALALIVGLVVAGIVIVAVAYFVYQALIKF